MAKKNNIQDIFEGIKYVDKLLNEAADIDETNELSFEDKLESKLKEMEDDSIEQEDSVEAIEEYSYNYNYNYNYDNPENFLGEEETSDLDNDSELTKLSKELHIDEDFSEEDFESKMFEENQEDLESDEDIEDIELMEALFEDDELEANNEEPAPIDIEAAAENKPDADAVENEFNIDVAEEEFDIEEMPMAGAEDDIDTEADFAAEPSGTEEIASNMETTPISQPEDIDMLIASILPENEEALTEENELKNLGFEDLDELDIKDKVKMESTIKENMSYDLDIDDILDLEYLDLGDEDLEDEIDPAVDSKKTFYKEKGKYIHSKDYEFKKLEDEDLEDLVATENPKKLTQPKFASLQKENAQKTKALYALAEQVVDLQDETSKLKLENYKLSKINSILTLLPELTQSTREKLVEKFDKCKSFTEVKKLFNEVASMVKEYKKGSLNEAIIKNNKSTKFIISESSEDNTTLDQTQARKNMLMGIPGHEDQYFNY